ncbi:hypothetical protein MMC17_006797 [Xylographa soralifera]|nr:hypothetical protein [Xylographa soralifera]
MSTHSPTAEQLELFNAVAELGPGVSEACCPEFTQCPGNFNQSTDDTRCQFTPSASTSTTTSTASSSTSSTTTSTAITTSTSISLATTAVSQTVVTSPTSQPINSASTPSNSLSAGADAGIAVVSTLAVIAVAGAAFWMWRKRAKRQNHSASAYHKADAAHNLGKPPDNNFIDRENYGKHELPDDHRNELPAEQHELLEFPTGREAQELPTSEYGSDSDRRR